MNRSSESKARSSESKDCSRLSKRHSFKEVDCSGKEIGILTEEIYN